MAGAEILENAPKINRENDPHACERACPEDRDGVMRIDFRTSMPRCQLEYSVLVLLLCLGFLGLIQCFPAASVSFDMTLSGESLSPHTS
jgi:hypothetical protein